MARNIEVKVQAHDLQAVGIQAAAIADNGPIQLIQEDRFFDTPTGRLKLRIQESDQVESDNGTKSELIGYHRDDSAEARASNYFICPTEYPEQLTSVLSFVLKPSVVVRKTRQLYLVGRTRIHLDTVDELGQFVEIEVVMRDDQPDSQGQEVLAQLIKQLHLENAPIIDVAYADLLLSQ